VILYQASRLPALISDTSEQVHTAWARRLLQMHLHTSTPGKGQSLRHAFAETTVLLARSKADDPSWCSGVEVEPRETQPMQRRWSSSGTAKASQEHDVAVSLLGAACLYAASSVILRSEVVPRAWAASKACLGLRRRLSGVVDS